jgi:hypothetical protein
VILVDIAVNWTALATSGGIPPWGAVNQTLFAILVLATAPALLRWCRRRETATVRTTQLHPRGVCINGA